NTAARALRLIPLCFAVCLPFCAATIARAENFSACLANIRGPALGSGVDSATFDNVTRGLTPNPDVLAMAEVQPEFKTPLGAYLAGLADEERFDDGRAMMARWKDALATAESRYGVDKATITAVWGVESDYGKSFGTRPVVQSLATLACSSNRRAR